MFPSADDGGNGGPGVAGADEGGSGAASGEGAASGAGAGEKKAASTESGADGEACSFGGYCAPGEGDSVIGEYLQGVDWSRTRMYQLGLTGIYLNKRGREAGGVLRSDEYRALKRELKEKIESIRHPETGEVAITAVYDTEEVMSGPYTDGAPDLIIGYNVGYRASWDAAVGKSGATVVEDNVKSWSGDHCIDYSLVPGVVFSSRKIVSESPGLIDIGPSILKLFGVKVPEYMQGRSIFEGGGGDE